MKQFLLAAIFSLAAVPALAQTLPTPGSLGGNQVGTGAVEPPATPAGSSAAITGTPVTGPASSGSTTLGASATTGASTGTGSSGGGSRGGGGHGGGMEALCLSAKGSVTSVDPDEFGLDCQQ